MQQSFSRSYPNGSYSLLNKYEGNANGSPKRIYGGLIGDCYSYGNLRYVSRLPNFHGNGDRVASKDL